MDKRITVKILQAAIGRINKIVNQKDSGGSKMYFYDSDGKYQGTVPGHFFLSQQNGSYAVSRFVNTGGGQETILGYSTKPVLISLIYAYIKGLCDGIKVVQTTEEE
jgi:hypothetical protein